MDNTILVHVACNLSIYDIHHLSCVCSSWHSVLEDEGLWRYVYNNSKFFTPLKNVKQPKDQYKKQYQIWKNMQNGICTRKTNYTRERGEVLYAFDKFYFVGPAGFRIYDSTDNRCLGGSRPDFTKIPVQRDRNRTVIRVTIEIRCVKLRCDGTYILALEKIQNKFQLSVWKFADVINGKEEPLRSWSDTWLSDVESMQFNSQSKVIVLQANHSYLVVLHFETFQILYQASKAPYRKSDLALYKDQVLVSKSNRTKLLLLDVSDPSKPKKIWKKNNNNHGELFRPISLNEEYILFLATTIHKHWIYVLKRPNTEISIFNADLDNFSVVNFNPQIGCLVTGNCRGTIRVWNLGKQQTIYKSNAYPHISKWDKLPVTIHMKKGMNFVHLFDDKILAHCRMRNILTWYDFADTTQIKEYPDSDDDCDPKVYHFCIVSVAGNPHFIISARMYAPVWDPRKHERQVLPPEFLASNFFGKNENQMVSLYRYINKNDPVEGIKKGRAILLALGMKENPELADKLIAANFVPDLAIYHLCS